MVKYVINRLIISFFTVLVLVTVVFVLVRLLPGDPFTSEKVIPEIRQNMMRYYGFDKPLPVQYLIYIKNLLKGDLGTSLKYNNRTVRSIIAETFPYSADLGIRAILFATVMGIFLGITSSLHRGRFLDYFCIIIAIIGVSVPDFIMGSLLQYIFGVKFKLLPVAQWKGFRYTILPVFALSLYTLALITRIMRASMLDVMHQDYIMTAEAKGLSTFQIVWRHQIRNAILPVVTILGPITAAVLTGTFVIEWIYAIPGMGKFYVLGIQNLDYSMILGMTVFYGVFLIAANFIVDILYGLIDPRIRIIGK
ncbi:ABC transporter permease [Thermoanaerobacterium sp. DL9XJH110]|uniref:ABC transporter permease n=1 Tax=Thermoanaerobacterium sp. DL9XJH110 TaxID=3386643 RepID=UPI003BB646AC